MSRAEITFAGVGSAFAHEHHQTNFLITKGDAHILVDFGMTGPAALRDVLGMEPTDIGVILPTHSHADHVGGIECLALMNRYVGQRFMGRPKLKIVVTEEYQRILWDCTLRGGLEYNEEDDKDRKLNFADFFDVIRPRWKSHQPRETFEVDYRGIHIELFRTKHVPEQATSWEASFVSFGLLIDDRIFVSGDTRFDPDLIDLYAERSEIMFHDVQFFPGAVHAPLDDLKTLPKSVTRKMYLIHYADDYGQQDIAAFAGWAQEGVAYTA